MHRMSKAAVMIGLGMVALSVAAPAGAARLADWYGRYVWEESLGRIGGATPAEGVAAFVTHTLTLGRSGGSTGCMLNAEGFQTDEHIRCTATPQGNALVVKFYGLAAQSRGATYRRGTPLFTLMRTPAGLVTRLQASGPTSDAGPRRGRLFRRIG